jgi:hypothetical protein
MAANINISRSRNGVADCSAVAGSSSSRVMIPRAAAIIIIRRVAFPREAIEAQAFVAVAK